MTSPIKCVLISRTGGGDFNYFLTGCVAHQGLKHLPISKDFFQAQKTADFMVLFCFVFEIFTNRDPFLRVFSTSQMADFTIFFFFFFFCNFCEMGPPSKDFLTKMELMSKDFW